MTVIRDSRPDDVRALLAIYAEAVRTGTASFELEPPSLPEMAGRRGAIVAAGLPHLVAERDGRVVGFAYAGPYRARPAYRHTLEDSIYIDPAAQGAGVGRALLGAVIERSAALGYRQMIAVIGDSANTGSIGLHAALGFAPIGVLPSVGFKFGRWIDSVLMQRALGPGDTAPPTRP